MNPPDVPSTSETAVSSGKPPSEEWRAAALRAEQFSVVVRHTPGMMLANVCNSLVVVIAFWGDLVFGAALMWAAAVFSVTSHIYLRHRRRRRAPRSAAPRARAFDRAVVNALALGSCWAALPLLFFQGASPTAQFLIACLSAGMLCGGAFALASIPVAAVAFTAPIALGSFVTLLRSEDRNHLLAAVVLGVYTLVLLRGVFAYAEQLKTRVLTQLDSELKASERMKKLHASGLNAIGGMATGLAHEVNQPLAATVTYLQTARRLMRIPPEARPSPVEPVLDKAIDQAARAIEIITHLRQFVLRGEPDKTLVGLHEVVDEACEAARTGASRASVEIDLHLGAANDRVLVDRIQIRQVLVNLIRNAIDAMHASNKRKLTIATSLSGDLIKTDVSDTGSGLSEAIRGELFEPFTTTKPDSMGVGLSISRSIIEAHGGKIWAHSNPAGGANFSFTLPLESPGKGH